MDRTHVTGALKVRSEKRGVKERSRELLALPT